jgi:hypothetical protein
VVEIFGLQADLIEGLIGVDVHRYINIKPRELYEEVGSLNT